MNITNIEFKAKVESIDSYEKRLLQENPRFIGFDNQTDTYFDVPVGRLKLREGNIENALIHYYRENTASSKKSEIILFKHKPDAALKQILTLQFGIKTIVKKERKIYIIENVKFHFDNIEGLGEFVEVEVIDEKGDIPRTIMQKQCDTWQTFLRINDTQLVKESYSDLLGIN